LNNAGNQVYVNTQVSAWLNFEQYNVLLSAGIEVSGHQLNWLCTLTDKGRLLTDGLNYTQ